MKVMICGSRDYADLEAVRAFVRSLPEEANIVTGGAQGVDRTAEDEADATGRQTTIMLPDWKEFGRSAGPIRNQQMVDYCDYGVAFWDGKSPGTKDAIERLKRAGKLRPVEQGFPIDYLMEYYGEDRI